MKNATTFSRAGMWSWQKEKKMWATSSRWLIFGFGVFNGVMGSVLFNEATQSYRQRRLINARASDSYDE
jgi:hypothetical protein